VNAPPAGRELREPQRLLALFVSLLYLLLALRAAKDLKESDAFKAAVVALLTSENLLLLEPTVWDTVGAKCLYLPVTLPTFLAYHGSWFLRHTVQGLPYSPEEQVTLLKGAVEEYDELSEKQQAELAEKECWKAGNLAAWRAAKKRN
jgi:hypothetical protein